MSPEHDGSDVLLELPEGLRDEFKDPFGPLFTDAEELLTGVSGPIVAVGDVVTYHLLAADRVPNMAVIDGYTERSPVDGAIREAIEAGGYDRRVRVSNPAAALSAALLDALVAGLSGLHESDETSGDSTAGDRLVVEVDGEEDLATLPAIVGAPNGTSVVYGQPGEGMVRVSVAANTRKRARELLARMHGDHEAVWAYIDAPGDR